MEISFSGHSPSQRVIEFDEADLASLNDLLRKSFLTHIAYADFSRPWLPPEDHAICSLCQKYGVDPEYRSDRVAFFQALLGVSDD